MYGMYAYILFSSIPIRNVFVQFVRLIFHGICDVCAIETRSSLFAVFFCHKFLVVFFLFRFFPVESWNWGRKRILLLNAHRRSFSEIKCKLIRWNIRSIDLISSNVREQKKRKYAKRYHVMTWKWKIFKKNSKNKKKCSPYCFFFNILFSIETEHFSRISEYLFYRGTTFFRLPLSNVQ